MDATEMRRAIRCSRRRDGIRTAFLLLGLLPTALTAAALGTARSALYDRWQTRRIERRLSERLDADVTVRLAILRPGTRQLHDVIIVDAETGTPLFSCRRVDVELEANRRLITLLRPHVPNAAGARWLELVHEALLERARARGPTWSFRARDAIVGEGDHAQTFSYVEGEWSTAPRGPALSLEAGQAYGEGTDLRVVVQRHRDGNAPRTTFTIETGSRPLPTLPVARWWPAVEALGRDGAFAGVVEGRVGDGVRSCFTVRGRFSQIDLSRCLAQFPHKLSGTAELNLEECRIDDGRLTLAKGRLSARSGVISRSLLEAATEELPLESSAADRDPSRSLWRFRRMDIEFAVDGSSLRLAGRCPESEAGTLLAGDGGPLLRGTPGTVGSAVALIRILAPDAAAQVPASEATRQLIRWLPSPRLELSESGRSLYVPLRMR